MRHPLNKTRRFSKAFLLWVFFCLGGVALAGQPPLGLLQPGEYPLIAVNNHCPSSYKNSKDYWNSLQQVELKLGGQDRFRDLPALHTQSPFTGEIVLGDPPQRFGVIVDVVGAEKRLYIDSNADGSFAGEQWTPLLNEWQGLQIYLVEGPEPVSVQVQYPNAAQRYPLQLQLSGVLNKPGPLYKEKPFLKVLVTTWFLAKLVEDGGEKLAAVVDRDNNGRFNDSQDQIFIDYNDDGYFSDNEAIQRKNGIRLRSGRQNLNVTWGVYPEKMVIGGTRHD